MEDGLEMEALSSKQAIYICYIRRAEVLAASLAAEDLKFVPPE